MFYGCSSFNQPLARFDTSNVTNTAGMFYGCTAFGTSRGFQYFGERFIIPEAYNFPVDRVFGKGTNAKALRQTLKRLRYRRDEHHKQAKINAVAEANAKTEDSSFRPVFERRVDSGRSDTGGTRRPG